MYERVQKQIHDFAKGSTGAETGAAGMTGPLPPDSFPLPPGQADWAVRAAPKADKNPAPFTSQLWDTFPFLPCLPHLLLLLSLLSWGKGSSKASLARVCRG